MKRLSTRMLTAIAEVLTVASLGSVADTFGTDNEYFRQTFNAAMDAYSWVLEELTRRERAKEGNQ